MGDISREELNAFTSSHEKVAGVLEKIAGQLERITLSQEKLLDKMSNGITKDIIEGVTHNYNTIHKETIVSLEKIQKFNDNTPTLIDDKITNSQIAKDIQHVKWFVGIIGTVIVVALVVIRGLDMRHYFSLQKEDIRQIVTEVDSIRK